MRRFNLFYFIKEGVKSIFLHGMMSFAAVAVIVACLLVTGSFALIAFNIDAIINRVESSNEMLAFVDEALTDDEAKALATEIKKVPNISDCIFISRNEALSDYALELGEDSDLLEGLENEKVLRHRYRIFLIDNSLMAETSARISGIDGIAKINANLEISSGINSIRNAIHIVSYILAAMLLVVSALIISNTVRLATFDRREEIAIMKIVGATNAFIRWPFIVEGCILGIAGGILAFFAEKLLYNVMVEKIGEFTSLFQMLEFSEVARPLLLIYIVFGFAVGTFGGTLTISKYLRV